MATKQGKRQQHQIRRHSGPDQPSDSKSFEPRAPRPLYSNPKSPNMSPGARPNSRPFYALRRVPQATPPSYVRWKLVPFVPKFAAVATTSFLADTSLPESLRVRLRDLSDRTGARTFEQWQRTFFDDPGLDTLFVRSLYTIARRGAALLRWELRTVIALGLDRSGHRQRLLPLVPKRGYDALMVGILVAGTATGQFRGGPVHTRVFLDSENPDFRVKTPVVVPGAPSSIPDARRLDPPHSLGDMAADVDDLTWTFGTGQPVKIVRVGSPDQPKRRRWIVSIPGTDHITGPSTANPADTETNIREELNVPSAMRVGVINSLHHAMSMDGIPEDQWVKEPVIICGHSQGGIVATSLAAADPADLGANVVAVLTMGSPSKRFRLRPGVVMLAVEHDQDVVPSADGTPAQAPDQRVMVWRTLVRPRRQALYYAHSSATYTATVRQVERKVRVAPWGRVAWVVQHLQQYLPATGEPTRVTFHEIWQELLQPVRGLSWDMPINIDQRGWEPVDFDEAYRANPIALPKFQVSSALKESWDQVVERARQRQEQIVEHARRRQEHARQVIARAADAAAEFGAELGVELGVELGGGKAAGTGAVKKAGISEKASEVAAELRESVETVGKRLRERIEP